MIPFTPDERRAQFAPSQNPGGPVDPDVLAVLGQPAQEPAVAQPTMNQQVDPDVLDIVNRDQIPLMSSLMSASRVNPDQAAEASRLGARIGVGQDVALRNLDEVRQRAFMADMQARDIARTNPVLASFLMDRNFSQQASDDVGLLDDLKNVFMDIGRGSIGMPMTYIPGELARGYMRGQRVAERGEIGLKATFGEAAQSDYDRARQLQEEMRTLGEPGFLSSAAEMVAQNVAGMREVAATTLIGGAAGTVIPVLGTAAGMGIGFATGTAATTARMEAGNLYLDLIEQGVSEDAAVPAALAGGLINGAIEAVGAKIATAPFKSLLSKVVRERMAEAVTRPTIRAALTQAGKSYVLQVGSEAAEEGTQELTNIVSEEMAKWSDGIKSETTLGQAVDRIIESTAQGAMGAAIIGGIGPGANLAIDLKRAQRAGRQTKFFESLTQNATESKVRGRDAGAYERFVAAQAAGTNAETVFVDGATMRGVLEQAAVTDSQLDAVVPGLAQKVRDAATTGSDVTIPTAQYAARLAGTDLGNALLPHMRLAPDAISATEAQAVEASRAEIVAQAEKLMEEKQTVDAAFVQSAQAVEDSIFNAVKAVGYSDVQARTYAKIHQAMVVVDAAAMGITPEEYNRRYLPTIVGEGMAVQAPAVPQAEATVPATQFADVATATTDASTQVDAAVAAGELNEKQARQARNSVEKLNRASVGGKIAELAQAAWQATRRNIGALKNAVDKANAALAALGVEVVDPVGREYVDGWVEVEIVMWEPYQEGQANEAPHVVRTVSPIVRRNGQIIARGQVVVREGSPQYIARQEQLEESKRAEMRARLGGAPQAMEQAAVPEPSARVIELLPTSRLLDERGFGPITHPVDGDEVAAGQAMRTVLGGIDVPRKYLKTPEAFDYLLGAINQVLLNKSKDSTDYDRAAASMGRALRTDLATVDDIVIAAKKLNYSGVDQDLRLEAEAALTKTDVLEVLDQIPIAPEMFDQAARIDSDYMAAIERGDMATAQRMVDEAEKAWIASTERSGNQIMPTTGTTPGDVRLPLYRFVEGTELRDPQRDIHWTHSRRDVEQMASESAGFIVVATHPGLDRVLDWESAQDRKLMEREIGAYEYRASVFPEVPIRPGKMEIVSITKVDADGNRTTIQSADPVTRDEAGNVVPLSRRFNITSPRIFEQAAIPFAQAPISPGFYSALAKAVDAVDAKSMAASGWKERIKGLVNKGDVKQDEVDWSGLTDWLDMQEGKVTRETVAEFLKNNGVRVERVFLSDRAVDTAPYTVEESVDTEGNEIWIVYDPDASREMGVFDNQIDAEREADRLTDAATIAKGRPSGETKYGQYTLPGGTNYREVLITLPVDQEARRAAQERYNALVAEGVPLSEALDRANESVAREYRSPHWNQPNVLVHFRLNDRVDADGKRVLFVEEIQSDWGRAGRDVGFVPTAVRRQAIIDEYNAAQAELAAAVPGTDAQASAYERFDRAGNAYNKEINDASIPRSPFVETTDGWLNLALKNIMLEATQGNYDRVAFVTGKQSADRYSLEKTVSLIEVVPRISAVTGERTRSVTLHLKEGGRPSFGIDANGIIDNVDEKTYTNLKGKPLADVVGKEMAEKIMAVGKGDRASFEGDDLKVGGKGMIEFYDKIVPAAVNKLLKKYGGGKLETTAITGTGDVKNYDINPVGSRWRLVDVYTREQIPDTPLFNTGSAAEKWIQENAPATQQAAFSVTPEMVKKLESGLPLFQAMPAGGPARGGFDPRRLTTIINKGADVTTLFHELIHYKVEVYLRMANAGAMPEQQKADLDYLFKFMGVAGATFEERMATYNGLTFEQRRPLEEKITYNFEDYLLEGKAPSVEMRGVFDRIAAWMRRVYKSLRDDLNAIYKREFGTDLPILTPEIRAVFDRMLASEEQIKRAEAVNNMKGLFQTQEQSGMDDATWAAYQAMLKEATDAAIAALTADTMKQVEWMSNARSKKLKELQKAHDTQRKEVRDQVMAEVRQEPIYRAMEYLKRGTLIGPDGSEATVEGVHKISTALAREFVPGLDMAKMGRGKYGYLAEDGLHPDIVAEMFGFPAGSALLQALADAKPMREVVDARTDEIMVRDYSEMGDPKAQEAAVNRAIHNEARARLVAVEARWLSKATQPVRIIQEAARQAAVDAVGNTVIRDLRPDQYAAAEARASRDAIEAARGADTKRLRDRYGADATREQIMLQAKRQQLYQNALATEAQKADDAIQKGLKYLRRVLRDSNRKRMGADAADQISAILDNFSLVPMTRSQREKVRALRDWLATNAENGLMLDVDPALADAANRKNYVEMTVTEFNDLIDSVKQIEYNGKHEAEIRLGKEKAIFAEKRDEITANMEQVAEKRGRKVRKELGDEDRKWMNTIASWDASQQTIGSITYLLDGGQRDGPLSRYLVATANDAGNQESEDTARITEIVNNILDPIAKKGGFSAKKITFPQIGEALSLRNRMVIALNYGNQSNIDRLLAGEGWSEETVQQIIATLTEEELNAVQALWDVMSSFKDRVAEKSRRLTGKEPRWIDPKPFTIRSSDGKIVQMRGGYYPAKYNPLRSIGARVAEVAEDADRMRREAFTASTTSRSFEKNRSDRPPQGQVLTREFTGLYAGLKEVIHDLAWHDWSIAANRLLRDKDFQRIIKERYGNQTYTAIKDWVDTVVVGDRTKHDPFEMFAVYARRNVSAAAMGLRLMTAAIQPTGVFPAMSRNGIRSMVRAAAEFGYAPLQSTRNAVERSKFMENRNRTRFRDLNEIRNVVQEESALSRVQKKYLSSAYVLVSFVQGVVDTITWMSAYSNSIAAGKSEQDAIFIADQTVIDTQGSGRLQDLSRAMRGGEKQSAYAKLFTSFYQYSNTMYALATTQVRTAPNYGKMTKDLVLILTVGALVEEMIRHALKPSADEEPEDMMKKLVGNQIDFVIGLPFGLREFRGVGAWMMDTKGGGLEYRGPSGLRMVSDVNRALVQIKQGEFDRALRKSIITLMGTTFGIPSAQINDTIDGIEALYEGETENVLAPVTGVRR